MDKHIQFQAASLTVCKSGSKQLQRFLCSGLEVKSVNFRTARGARVSTFEICYARGVVLTKLAGGVVAAQVWFHAGSGNEDRLASLVAVYEHVEDDLSSGVRYWRRADNNAMVISSTDIVLLLAFTS